MTNGVTDPKYVGMSPPEDEDPLVKRYKEEFAKRKAARQANAPKMPIPNLARAKEEYKVGQEARPMTLAQIGEAQRNMDAVAEGGEKKKPGLSPETIAGLKALHEQSQKDKPAMEKRPLPPQNKFSPLP